MIKADIRPPKLKLEYRRLRPAYDPSTRSGRLKSLLVRFLSLLPALLAVGFASISCLILMWLGSERRQVGIAIYRTSCSEPPWYLFPETEGEAFYSSDDFHVPARPDARPISSDVETDQSISIVQVCSYAHKQSWYLEELLSNHKDYAKQWGLEYNLYTGSKSGVWAKQEALYEKLLFELEKPEEDRLQWLFYTDVDTVLVSYAVPLQSFLPPEDDPAYILIAKDTSDSLNAGVFFVRVCQEALDYMHKIITWPRDDKALSWAEQSVMIILDERERMAETGKLVYMPQEWFNSYAGENAYMENLPVFQVHFPSRPRKRYEMLPFLRKLANGEIVRDPEDARLAKNRLLQEIKEFWETRRASASHQGSAKQQVILRWSRIRTHCRVVVKPLIGFKPFWH